METVKADGAAKVRGASEKASTLSLANDAHVSSTSAGTGTRHAAGRKRLIPIPDTPIWQAAQAMLDAGKLPDADLSAYVARLITEEQQRQQASVPDPCEIGTPMLARPIWRNAYAPGIRYTLTLDAYGGGDTAMEAPTEAACLELEPHAAADFLRLVHEEGLSVVTLLAEAIDGMLRRVLRKEPPAFLNCGGNGELSRPWDWWRLEALAARLPDDVRDVGEELMERCHSCSWSGMDALCGLTDRGAAMLRFADRCPALAEAAWQALLDMNGDRHANVGAEKNVRAVLRWAFEHGTWPGEWPLATTTTERRAA